MPPIILTYDTWLQYFNAYKVHIVSETPTDNYETLLAM